MTTRTLSTGDPSTLGSYIRLARAVFGGDSEAVLFLQKKIDQSDKGENEPVVADESQVVQLLVNMHANTKETS